MLCRGDRRGETGLCYAGARSYQTAVAPGAVEKVATMTLNDSGFARRAVLAAVAAGGLCAAPLAGFACVDGAPKGEAVTIQRDVGTTAAGQRADFHVIGAGWFHAAEIVKQGGSSDNTKVTVELDGEEVLPARSPT